VFLGYRVASYGDLVNCLYDKLKAEGVNVWWDKRCLTAGQPCEQGFADGLCSCDVFVKAGLARLAYLTATSACDNVLIEHQLALVLQHCGDLRVIFPSSCASTGTTLNSATHTATFSKVGVCPRAKMTW